MPRGMPPQAKALKMGSNKPASIPIVGGSSAGSLSDPGPIPFWVQNQSYPIGQQVIFDNQIYYAKVAIPVGFPFDVNNFKILSAGGGGDYLVDINGTGTNLTIQEAIDEAETRGGPATIRVLGGTYTENITITKPGISVSGSSSWSGITNVVGNIDIALTATGEVQLSGLEITGKVECSGSQNTLFFVRLLSVTNSGGVSPMVLSNTHPSSTLIPSEMRLTETGDTAPALDITSDMRIDEIIGGGSEYRRNGSSNSAFPAIQSTGDGLLRLNSANLMGQLKVSSGSGEFVLINNSTILVSSGDAIDDTGYSGLAISITNCSLNALSSPGNIFSDGTSGFWSVISSNFTRNGTDIGIYALKDAVVASITAGTNINNSGTASNPIINLDDIIIGSGANGLLSLKGGSNSPNGGDVEITGGDGATNGGDLNFRTGFGNAGSGGNFVFTGEEGTNANGGSFAFTGGTAATDDGSGVGGGANFTGGEGGFVSGDGGSFNFLTGTTQAGTGSSGSITLEIGADGGGGLGNVSLAPTRGNVGIGTSDPQTILDIQGPSPVVTVRSLSDFGRSEVSIYGSRNAGAGTATIGHLNGYNTRSGSDIVTGRIAFANGVTGTSAGSLQFLTRQESDSGLTVRMIVDDLGRVGIGIAIPDASAQLDIVSTDRGFSQPSMTEAQRDAIASPTEGLGLSNLDTHRPNYFDGTAWRSTASLASFEEDIFEASDLDILASGDVITVDGVFLLINLKEPITSTKRFNVINGGRLNIRFNSAWTYSGTGTFLTVATGGTINIKEGAIFGNSSATLFDVTAASSVSFSFMTVLFFGEYGTIRETSDVLMSTNGFFVGNGTLDLIDNRSTAISNVGFSSGTPVSGALIRVSGADTGFFDFSASNFTLQSGESFIRFDPFAPILAATIDNVRAIGGDSLFDTSGTAGTFTAVADASIALTTIDSVTDSGGIARFNFTVGPTLFVDQEMDISNFVTETNYNQKGLISATGAGFFEIAGIPFTADDATGDFSSASITLTDTGTSRTDGDTLTLDTDDSTDYDSGVIVYNQLTNSFQVSLPFTTTQTGTWSTAGIDQEDPRVLANNNAGFEASSYIGSAFVNNNTTTTSIAVSNTFNDIVFGTGGSALIAASTMERFKLIDEIAGVFEYIGNEPFDGEVNSNYSVVSSGGNQEFRFSWVVDKGSGFVALDDDVEALADVGSTATSVSKQQPMCLVKGNKVKPQVTRNAGTSTLTFQYVSINIFD